MIDAMTISKSIIIEMKPKMKGHFLLWLERNNLKKYLKKEYARAFKLHNVSRLLVI